MSIWGAVPYVGQSSLGTDGGTCAPAASLIIQMP